MYSSMNLTCKRGSVGQSAGLSIPRSSIRFRLKPENSNSHGSEVHRPSIKGTKTFLKVIKSIHHNQTFKLTLSHLTSIESDRATKSSQIAFMHRGLLSDNLCVCLVLFKLGIWRIQIGAAGASSCLETRTRTLPEPPFLSGSRKFSFHPLSLL